MPNVAGLESHEKLTLEIGSTIIVSALAVGLQLGNWSPWCLLPAVGGYVLWVIAYSELTLRTSR